MHLLRQIPHKLHQSWDLFGINFVFDVEQPPIELVVHGDCDELISCVASALKGGQDVMTDGGPGIPLGYEGAKDLRDNRRHTLKTGGLVAEVIVSGDGQ